MQLAWNVKDLSDLNDEVGRKKDTLREWWHQAENVWPTIFDNFAKRLSLFCESTKEFVKKLTKYVQAHCSHSYSGGNDNPRRMDHQIVCFACTVHPL